MPQVRSKPQSHKITEAEFLEMVIELAQLSGWRIFHPRPARTKKGWVTALQGDAGYPDLCLVKGDRLIFSELKSAEGQLTTSQEGWLKTLKATGKCEVYVWRLGDWPDVVDTLAGATGRGGLDAKT